MIGKQLISSDINLGEVNINRGIFQGDSIIFAFHDITDPFNTSFQTDETRIFISNGKSKLNHLLFMDDLKLYESNQNEIDSLVRTAEIVAKDIGMRFDIDKCGVLATRRGKEVEYNRIEFENGEEIGQIGEKGYKYLSILERDIYQEEVKENIRKEYFKRLRATLKSKLMQSMYSKQ